MPLPRWLRSLLPRAPSPTGAPPPPGGEGWGGGPGPANPTEIQPPPNPQGEGGAPPDTSHRIHIAANDPEFPAKREAAIELICAAITELTAPLGYTRKGTTWARATLHGKTAINLQRSRYGFTAAINLRFLLPDGTSPQTGIWAGDDDVRLHLFYHTAEAVGLDDGEITYLDVHQNPASLDLPRHILATRALPWLEAHHAATGLPPLAAYLPR